MTAKAEPAKGSQPDATKDAQGTVDSTGAQTKKTSRRGVGAARGTTRLKFTHELAKPNNGLFIAHLESVEVKDIDISESSTGMPSFNGLSIPRIAFTFTSNEEDPNKRHYTTLSFNAVESNVKTIPDGDEEWKVNQIFDWFKHILNVYYFKGRELTDAEVEALGLPFEDFDEQGEYSPVEPEDVIAGWRTLFENVENLLNRGADDKPVFKSKDNKFIAVWIKLLRYVKNRKKNAWQAVNNGDLSFPSFVGEGCIEIFKQNAPPSIRLDAVKEAIHPMNIETKAKSPNMSGVPAFGMPGDMGGNFANGGMGGDFSNIGSEAGSEDMPF